GGAGIGRAIVERLSQEGAKVAIFDWDFDSAQEVAEANKAIAFKVDVSDPKQVDEAFKEVITRFEGVDTVINNAGINRDKLLIRMDDESWDEVIKVNLYGTFYLSRLAAKTMIKARFGRIVNIASVIGLIGNPGQANYAASKAGIIALTKSMAKELAPRGITVNTIAPGFIKTAMTDALSDEIKEWYLSMIPIKRFGEPHEIAGVVRFLLSEEADYITGQVITVDGGLVM
ncbi:MAG TPA: 3-oxoacyl-[acyl-carrier-protein] reductase, partial [bacterium (Candidatus Stahlbacteria)]|nr:3-oxoacyl-[acyl-carrier-protein] reductase [Candidatus Stahlbacteria bacterium]